MTIKIPETNKIRIPHKFGFQDGSIIIEKDGDDLVIQICGGRGGIHGTCKIREEDFLQALIYFDYPASPGPCGGEEECRIGAN